MEKAAFRLPARGPSWDRTNDPLIMSQVGWLVNMVSVSQMLPNSNKKACKLLVYSLQHFCFVDKRSEKSNLELIKDIISIFKLEEVLSKTE